MSQLRGIIKKKLYTSKNQRFHLFRLKLKNRKIQAIYFGFNPPACDNQELMFTGEWQQNSEYGTQFLIKKYEEAGPCIERKNQTMAKISAMLAN